MFGESTIVNMKISKTDVLLDAEGSVIALELTGHNRDEAFLAAYKVGEGVPAMDRLVSVVGVASWFDLTNQSVRVRIEGFPEQVVGIANIIEEKWIYTPEFAAELEETRKLAKARASGPREKPFQPHSFSSQPDLLGDHVPTVFISPEAYRKMLLYVELAPKEEG
jgi:hypothetical protein